jgi:hypothetical protein
MSLHKYAILISNKFPKKFNILTVNKTLERIKRTRKIPGMKRKMYKRTKTQRNHERSSRKSHPKETKRDEKLKRVQQLGEKAIFNPVAVGSPSGCITNPSSCVLPHKHVKRPHVSGCVT